MPIDLVGKHDHSHVRHQRDKRRTPTTRQRSREHQRCVGVDKTFGVLQCNIVAILADGRLTLQGASVSKRIPRVGGTGEHYAITGGTGAYQGAAGTMTRTGNGDRDTLTLSLSS